MPKGVVFSLLFFSAVVRKLNVMCNVKPHGCMLTSLLLLCGHFLGGIFERS